MSFVPVSEHQEAFDQAQADLTAQIPPLRWIVVGYCFWLGIFFGALIMHAATAP